MKNILFMVVLIFVTVGLFAAEPADGIDQSKLVSVEGSVSDGISGESLTGVKLLKSVQII